MRGMQRVERWGHTLRDATPRGYAFLDRALYVPKSWFEDRARCRRAGIPDTVPFCTKPALARAMLARALDAEFPPSGSPETKS